MPRLPSVAVTIAAALVATALVAACAVDPPARDGAPHGGGTPVSEWSLPGTAWRLEALPGATLVEDARPTLEFPVRGRVAGNGGCNRFTGEVTYADGGMRLHQLVTTRRACTPEIMAQESRFLGALGRTRRATLDGSTLLVHGDDGDRPLRFSAIRAIFMPSPP